jgi:hypothetical protein
MSPGAVGPVDRRNVGWPAASAPNWRSQRRSILTACRVRRRIRPGKSAWSAPIMGMKPGLTPEKKALLHDLERSARAELKLRHKAIEYYLSHRSS